jgi:putative ABC transport system permease protein
MFNKEIPGWNFRNLDFLLIGLTNMIKAKTIGSSVMYIMMLFLAMLAIFDTQILSIFHRRKEMGTMMALGLTRPNIIKLFTLEGVLHAVLAIFMGAIYGIPLLIHFQKVGMQIGMDAKDWGLSGLDDALYPVYGLKLVLGTIIIVLITVTIVSYLPTRKIAKLKPTDALRGKMTK